MVKKLQKKYLNNEIKLIKYQWESLRTNHEYLQEYNQWRRIRRKPKFNRNRFEPRIIYFFQKKYGIEPIDPSFPFPDKPPVRPKQFDTSSKKGAQFFLWLYFIESKHAARCLTPQIENLIKRTEETKYVPNKPLTLQELLNQHSILISINLDVPINRIIKDVSSIVQSWKKQKLALGKKRQATRHRLQEYKKYFKVYKFIKQGYDWNKTAKRCYPNDYERDKHYAIKKVKRDYRRWMKIGYMFKNNPLLRYQMSYGFSDNYPELLTNKEYFLRFQEHCKKELTNPV